MKVYVGYICEDHAIPCWIGLDKNSVKKKIKEYEEGFINWAPETWITEYDLCKGEALDLDD